MHYFHEEKKTNENVCTKSTNYDISHVVDLLASAAG